MSTKIHTLAPALTRAPSKKFISLLLIQFFTVFILSACGGGGGGSGNQSPTLADASFNIPENAANGAVVGTVAGSDPNNGDILSYSIVQVTATGTVAKVAAKGSFNIGATSGRITVANRSALNPLPTEPWTITVQVADDAGETDTATVTITVTDVNVVPASILANPNLTVANIATNGASVGNALGSASDGLAFSIVGGNTGNAFNIDPVTGQITVNDASAINSGGTFQLEVQVTDGTLTDVVTIAITVNDVSIVPTGLNPTVGINGADIANGANVGAPLGTATDGLTFSIVGGNGAFAIDPETGQITVADSSLIVPGETTELVIQITDGTLTETITIAITVNDIVPATIPTPSIGDTATTGDVVGGPLGSADDGLTYSIIGGNTGGAFSIDPVTGQIIVSDETALGSGGTFDLIIQVTNGSITDTFTITITVNDVNEAPVLNDSTATIGETSPNGTNVGAALAATDPENDALTYSITTGNIGDAFAISATTGQITVADSTALNAGNTVLNVKVSDGKLDDTAVITITVLDSPEISIDNASRRILNRAADGTVIGKLTVVLGAATSITTRTLNAKGTDAPSLEFSINDKDEIILTSAGTLVGGNTHALEAVYSSDTGDSNTLDVTIDVVNDFAGTTAKVIAFGNSLTEGEGYSGDDLTNPNRIVQPGAVVPVNADGRSYRHEMFGVQGFSDNDVKLEFIGTRTSDWRSEVTNALARHDGHSGSSSDDIRDELPALKTSGLLSEADIVLITLGTNDALEEALGTGVQTESNIIDIITEMRSINPNLVFILGRVAPFDVTNSTIFDFGKTDSGQIPSRAVLMTTLIAANSQIADINTSIDNVAANTSTPTSPVLTADMQTVFTNVTGGAISTLLSDGIHPNNAGERVMAEKWVEAIDQFFDGQDDGTPVNK